MSLNRIVSKNLLLACRNNVFKQVRQDSTISTPPTYRMPFPEKVIMGTLMIACTWIIPVWVLCNVNNYNAKNKEN